MRGKFLNRYTLLLLVSAVAVAVFSFSKDNGFKRLLSADKISTDDYTAEARVFSDVEEYRAWYGSPESKNGLSREKTIGEFTYVVSLVPASILALRSMHAEDFSSDSMAEQKLRQKEAEYARQVYLQFRITDADGTAGTELLKKNLSSQNQYYSRIEYCAFKMQEDMTLVHDKDTLPCSFFHFERTYDAAPFLNFIAVFKVPGEVKKQPDEMTFMFEDNLFGSGKINLTFSRDMLLKMPQLKLKGI